MSKVADLDDVRKRDGDVLAAADDLAFQLMDRLMAHDLDGGLILSPAEVEALAEVARYVADALTEHDAIVRRMKRIRDRADKKELISGPVIRRVGDRS